MNKYLLLILVIAMSHKASGTGGCFWWIKNADESYQDRQGGSADTCYHWDRLVGGNLTPHGYLWADSFVGRPRGIMSYDRNNKVLGNYHGHPHIDRAYST